MATVDERVAVFTLEDWSKKFCDIRHFAHLAPLGIFPKKMSPLALQGPSKHDIKLSLGWWQKCNRTPDCSEHSHLCPASLVIFCDASLVTTVSGITDHTHSQLLKHATIAVVDNKHCVIDFSDTGTYVNEHRISKGVPHELKNGDIVVLGKPSQVMNDATFADKPVKFYFGRKVGLDIWQRLVDRKKQIECEMIAAATLVDIKYNLNRRQERCSLTT
jgi:hypothetical protein